MEQVDKIIKVLKTGEGKKGHWELLQIKTTTGKLATGFGLAEGDDVLLEYNQDYKNYSARKVEKKTESEPVSSSQDQSDLIKALGELTDALRQNVLAIEAMTPVKKFDRTYTEVEPTEEELNEPPF